MLLGRQYRVMPTIAAVLLAVILLLAWWFFFSGLPRRVRVSGLVLVILAAGATGALVKVRGLTGDFVPILAFRWETPATPAPVPAVARTAETLPSSSPAPPLESNEVAP